MLGRLFFRRTDSTALQAMRYFFVGGFGASLDIAVYSALVLLLSVDYRLAIVLSFTVGTLANFLLSNRFVFSRGSMSLLRACGRHYLSGIGGLAVNELVTMFIVEVLDSEALVAAKVVATAFSFVANFLLLKFFAFNSGFRLGRVPVRAGNDSES